MTYYKKHIFFCTNQKKSGKKCCFDADAGNMRDYAKKRVAKLGLSDVRVNISGCLGRCEEGPVIVVYPEGVWYTYHNKDDIDEIIEEHVANDRIVERLRLHDSQS